MGLFVGMRSCDLLKISYLCKVINTGDVQVPNMTGVVICLKFRIFAK